MKFSEAWLREWVNPDIGREALFEQLTMAGLEVEGFVPVAAEFTGVVVGRVIAAEPHPDADKLAVCRVSDGDGEFQVVCGAPNARAGLVTAFARVGARLSDDFTIRKAKLRGVESQGMLCSARELGLGDEHDGILELDDRLPAGVDLRTALALDDVTVELNLTPNRGDCLSLRGLAREVGVLNNVAVAAPKGAPVAATIDDVFAVTLTAPEDCPRYLGRVIRGVDNRRGSPFWLRETLRRAGLRSIDAVVDVTNYVMLELGQPMHAFDLGVLQQGIEVRRARAGESLELLDGQQVTLDAETLLITDATGPVAIAGVMGGARSGVAAETRDVFLESAFFAPLAVAGTARRYGLHTDASHRYERGVDFELPRLAIERATEMLLAILGGEPGPVTEAVVREHLPQRPAVSLREARLNALLGVAIPAAEVDQALLRLDFRLLEREHADGDGVRWTIEAPSHRFDIEREADLVEEVCRIYGYNRIEARRPAVALPLRTVPLDRVSESALKQRLASLGLQEAVTYSFVDPRLQDLLDPGVTALQLTNPMSSEQSVMRTNLLPGLVETLRVNVSRQQERVRLFEIGLCFDSRPAVPDEAPVRALRQRTMVGAICCGPRVPANWLQSAEPFDFFDLKGLVEQLFEWTGQQAVRYVAAHDPVMHPGQCAELFVGSERVGRAGRLHPEIEAALDIKKTVYFFEISGENLLRHPLPVHRGISRYPSVRRDLALVVTESVRAAAVETVIRDVLGDLLVDFRLFDVYRGKGIDSNEKSLAVGLTLQDPSATLTEDRISACTRDVLSALEQSVGARLR